MSSRSVYRCVLRWRYLVNAYEVTTHLIGLLAPSVSGSHALWAKPGCCELAVLSCVYVCVVPLLPCVADCCMLCIVCKVERLPISTFKRILLCIIIIIIITCRR